MLLIALLLLSLGLFGLRGVISNVYFVELIGSQYVFLFLRLFYWLCILVGAVCLFFWLRKERTNLLNSLGKLRQNWLYLLTLVLASVPFFYLVITKRLGLDFWLDEVISIRRHIVTSLSSALFWYPVPNNHVFTNALSGIYLKIVDAKDLLTVLQNPGVLRSFYLAFGVGALLVCALTAHRFVGRVAALLMVVLFGTTIAYLNFVVQVRGYSPSIFFAAGLQHSILSYRQAGKRSSALAALAFSAMLLYSIPSNLYFLLVIFFYFVLLGTFAWSQKRARTTFSLDAGSFTIVNRRLTISLALALGCGLAILFYLPILPKILENRYVETLGAFQGAAFPGLLLESLKIFISGRWWLFALSAIGLLAIFIDGQSERRHDQLELICFLAAIIVFPFLLSAARGDEPFVRSFFVLMPAFFLLAATGVQSLAEQIPQGASWSKTALVLALLAIFTYTNTIFFSSFSQNSSSVADTLANEDVDQVEYLDTRLAASVFTDHYHLRQVIKAFQDHADGAIPVLIDRPNTRYVFTLSVYFEAYDIAYEEFGDPAHIESPEAYIFLSYPNKALNEWQATYPNLACENISAVLTIYQVLHCRFD